MLPGCIADDFTGAGHLANPVACGGTGTIRINGVPVRAAVRLANHGPAVPGRSLVAVLASEAMEETANLILITRGVDVRLRTPAEVSGLDASFKPR